MSVETANDPLIVAQLEADAAWEAHRQLDQAHRELRSKFEELSRNRRRDYAFINAFEEIASLAEPAQRMSDKLCAARLLQIRDVIAKARERSREIAQRQASGG